MDQEPGGPVLDHLVDLADPARHHGFPDGEVFEELQGGEVEVVQEGIGRHRDVHPLDEAGKPVVRNPSGERDRPPQAGALDIALDPAP